jgi:UDP:flavonoid glycosyltransferase YjiC (YdhE family)
MKISISSIGTRGEVQPILALALELQSLGHSAVLCVAPNFKHWVESFGVACVPVGPDLKTKRKPSRGEMRKLVAQSVRDNFKVFTDASRGCELIVVAGGVQAAGRSIAESLKRPYVFATYCPVTLPSPRHPPPRIRSQSLPRFVNRLLWRSTVLIEAARTLGRRAIISQGWANLSPIDAKTDCITIGDVDHERLFPRVAAIVHHGGAGTTTAAARAGKPQVAVPFAYDQYYWSHRVQQLGIGASGPIAKKLTKDTLVSALRECLKPGKLVSARAVAGRIELHGARIAAERLVKAFG